MSHFGGQFNLLDLRRTCLSTRAQRIDSCDVRLLSQAFDVRRVFMRLCSRPPSVLISSPTAIPPEQRLLSDKIIFQYLLQPQIYTSGSGEICVPEPGGGRKKYARLRAATKVSRRHLENGRM